jgi:hypothetical protein
MRNASSMAARPLRFAPTAAQQAVSERSCPIRVARSEIYSGTSVFVIQKKVCPANGINQFKGEDDLGARIDHLQDDAALSELCDLACKVSAFEENPIPLLPKRRLMSLTYWDQLLRTSPRSRGLSSFCNPSVAFRRSKGIRSKPHHQRRWYFGVCYSCRENLLAGDLGKPASY